MISERQLARGFPGLWGELLPTLTPHFVHLFNEAYRKPLGAVGVSVRSEPDTDASVVAEFAFHLARIAHERGVPYQDAVNSDELLSVAESAALAIIGQYENQKHEPRTLLSPSERREGLLLVRNYAVFLARYSPEKIEFRPKVPGSGFVSACIADLSVEQTLFEVKTVERNIAGKDIRQLLIYLALNSASGERRWLQAGFLNPRRGLVYEFVLDQIVPLMAGGRLTAEVFQDLLRFFGTRDIQLDTAF